MFTFSIATADSINTELDFHCTDEVVNEARGYVFHYIALVDEQGREYCFRGERDAWIFCIDCDLEPVSYETEERRARADVFHDGQYVCNIEVSASVDLRYCVTIEH